MSDGKKGSLLETCDLVTGNHRWRFAVSDAAMDESSKCERFLKKGHFVHFGDTGD